MGKISYYRKGYVLENDIYWQFSKKGYYVIRSAGSHRLCDIIAIPNKAMMDDKPICIQCKKTSKPNTIPRISRKELNALKELEKNYNVKVLLALRYRMKGRWHTDILTIKEYERLKEQLKS